MSSSPKFSAIGGVFWMLISCALLAGVAAIGRYVALEGVPTFQTVFLRLIFAVLAFAPLFAVRGVELLRTCHLGLYLIRVFVGLFGMTTWFAALSYVSVGELTAIGFLAPIFGTIGAVFILGELVGWRRWTATFVGFLGALIILRPGVNEVDIGTWLAILAAFGMALSGLLIKTLTGKDDPDKVVLIALCLQAPVALIPALFVWQPLVLGSLGRVCRNGPVRHAGAYHADPRLSGGGCLGRHVARIRKVALCRAVRICPVS